MGCYEPLLNWRVHWLPPPPDLLPNFHPWAFFLKMNPLQRAKYETLKAAVELLLCGNNQYSLLLLFKEVNSVGFKGSLRGFSSFYKVFWERAMKGPTIMPFIAFEKKNPAVLSLALSLVPTVIPTLALWCIQTTKHYSRLLKRKGYPNGYCSESCRRRNPCLSKETCSEPMRALSLSLSSPTARLGECFLSRANLMRAFSILTTSEKTGQEVFLLWWAEMPWEAWAARKQYCSCWGKAWKEQKVVPKRWSGTMATCLAGIPVARSDVSSFQKKSSVDCLTVGLLFVLRPVHMWPGRLGHCISLSCQLVSENSCRISGFSSW